MLCSCLIAIQHPQLAVHCLISFFFVFYETPETTITPASIENTSIARTIRSVVDTTALYLSLIKQRGVTDRPTTAIYFLSRRYLHADNSITLYTRLDSRASDIKIASLQRQPMLVASAAPSHGSNSIFATQPIQHTALQHMLQGKFPSEAANISAHSAGLIRQAFSRNAWLM